MLLRIGDHPFIRHDWTIFYGDAMIVDFNGLRMRSPQDWRFVGISARPLRSNSSSRASAHPLSPGLSSCVSAASSGFDSGVLRRAIVEAFDLRT